MADVTSAEPAVSPTSEQEWVALVDELCLRYRNWGRWGAEDERGTLNFVTPAALVHASTLIRTGRVVSCALPFDSNGPQSGGFGGRTNPVHSMLADGEDILAVLVAGAGARIRWMIIVAGIAAYSAATLAVFVQALMGLPLIPA